MSAALTIALRELRGGLKGFRIFLLCLALGVGGIAAIGSLRAAIETGLRQDATTLLGGDADLLFSYRFADAQEQKWIDEHALASSTIIDMRSMVQLGDKRTLVQLKGVDAAYPLYGAVALSVDTPLPDLLAPRDGLAGMVAAQDLLDRLGLKPGDILKIGPRDYQLRAVLLAEPESTGFAFGPRVIVPLDALKDSGMLSTGTLFKTHYRLKFPPGADLGALQASAEAAMGDNGMSWSDARNGTPGIAKFVDRMGAFLVIVGLAGLAVGGIGVSAAVRSYLESKKPVIATLKTLGASSRMIFGIYLLQIGLLALLGIGIGLVLGGGAPLVLGPMFADRLPVPVVFALYPAPLLEAALYGILTALIFSIWPLARAVTIRAAGLFRDDADTTRHRPRWYFIVLEGALVASLITSAALFSGIPKLALWSAFGVALALGALYLAALATKALARRLARSRLTRGHPVLRLSLGAISAPGGEAGAVILSLGLGLSVLATVGQIDTNMRAAIDADIPAVAPAYLFIDIQPAQLQPFLDITKATDGVARTSTAPMMRAVVKAVNGVPAKQAFGDHWVARGDHALSFSPTLPEATTLTEGQWWPAGYSGAPQVSFSAKTGAELGLKLGDTLSLNILGRDMDATITSFRSVHFPDMQGNFLMVMNPAALAGAPHSTVATVYATKAAETPLVNAVGKALPNVTAIRVRNVIAQIGDMLKGISEATRWGAAASLLTGFVVLIGAAAAGERNRTYEAALLKTLGAGRARILASFALRAAILGAAAGIVAIAAGGLAGWAVMHFVMDSDFTFALTSALLIVSGGALASLLAGLAFAWRPLAARPAQVLRARE